MSCESCPGTLVNWLPGGECGKNVVLRIFTRLIERLYIGRLKDIFQLYIFSTYILDVCVFLDKFTFAVYIRVHGHQYSPLLPVLCFPSTQSIKSKNVIYAC